MSEPLVRQTETVVVEDQPAATGSALVLPLLATQILWINRAAGALA